MARTLTSTPRHDGFRMPGEFEPHIGCWMLWPERSDNWRSGAKPAQRAFAAVAASQGIVVMPSFDDPQDARARDTIQALFPGLRTITIPSREILLGGGGIHCITLQEPLGRRPLPGKGSIG